MKLQWKKKDFEKGKNSFFPHDYESNSTLLIVNKSFSVKKNGWELYDNGRFIKAFDTLKAAKAYGESLVNNL